MTKKQGKTGRHRQRIGEWTIERFLTSGSYGNVYTVKRRDGTKGIAKIECSNDGTLKNEVNVLHRLRHLNGFPKLYHACKIRGSEAVVMQQLGESMADVKRCHLLCTKDILKIGIQMVERLRDLHSQGFVHRDIHDGNILTGDPSQGEGGKLYLIDFGCTSHVDTVQPDDQYGNCLFASNAALQSETYGPKDDLECLVYLLVYLYAGSLPWSRLLTGRVSVEKFNRRCLQMRISMSASEICDGLPGSILEMLRDVLEMTPEDTPDYEGYIQGMKRSLRNRNHSEREKFSWE